MVYFIIFYGFTHIVLLYFGEFPEEKLVIGIAIATMSRIGTKNGQQSCTPEDKSRVLKTL